MIHGALCQGRKISLGGEHPATTVTATETNTQRSPTHPPPKATGYQLGTYLGSHISDISIYPYLLFLPPIYETGVVH